jgi:predicted XRE-type DNA-binding protein
MTITETVHAAAIASGMSQRQLAEATGVPQSVISDFIRSGRCSSKSLDAIATHFGIVAKKSKKKKITVQPRHEGKAG